MSGGTVREINRAMREVGDAADVVRMQISAVSVAILATMRRGYRPQLLEERKRLQIIARRWRRAQVERNRRPALIHNGRKP